MPFGDPRPIRRRGRGLKVSSASRQRPDPQPTPPNPLKVGSMVQAALEIAPRMMIPLEVITGARLQFPNLPQHSALLDVRTEDGNEYTVLVISKLKPKQ